MPHFYLRHSLRLAAQPPVRLWVAGSATATAMTLHSADTAPFLGVQPGLRPVAKQLQFWQCCWLGLLLDTPGKKAGENATLATSSSHCLPGIDLPQPHSAKLPMAHSFIITATTIVVHVWAVP